MKDHFPISKTEEVELEINQKDGTAHNQKNGLLEWMLNVPAGSSKSVAFSYTVKYPRKGELQFD